MTKSHVKFTSPSLSGQYYTTTVGEHYTKKDGHPPRPAIQLPSNILSGPGNRLLLCLCVYRVVHEDIKCVWFVWQNTGWPPALPNLTLSLSRSTERHPVCHSRWENNNNNATRNTNNNNNICSGDDNRYHWTLFINTFVFKYYKVYIINSIFSHSQIEQH